MYIGRIVLCRRGHSWFLAADQMDHVRDACRWNKIFWWPDTSAAEVDVGWGGPMYHSAWHHSIHWRRCMDADDALQHSHKQTKGNVNSITNITTVTKAGRPMPRYWQSSCYHPSLDRQSAAWFLRPGQLDQVMSNSWSPRDHRVSLAF